MAIHMGYDRGKVAGTLFLAGGTQFVLGILVAEALYPSYSISRNYISDLGVGPSASIFNSSVFLLGLMVLAGAFFLQRSFRNRLVTGLLALAGVGAMGVGVFPENYPAMHEVVSVIAFVSGGLTPIAAYRLLRRPFNYFSTVLGLVSLCAMILLSAEYAFSLGEQYFLGLGPGGMERMIVYPILFWETALGGYLLAST